MVICFCIFLWVFSLVYSTKKTGKIWTSMISHVGMNSLVVIVNFIVINGN
ncbi:hypothetical protein [Tetragenococcus muriaticus]